ncbi:MAG TPA: hypothetical protein VG125_10865 [Pirellulales bacterium]|jgi:hypothetical protein|nr:hypothetical protein [Pirellulales bacterium]
MLYHLNCRHNSRLVSDRLERTLSWFESLCLGVHLLGCGPCRRFRRAIGWLHRALPTWPNDARLSVEARQRIRRALEEAAKEE